MLAVLIWFPPRTRIFGIVHVVYYHRALDAYLYVELHVIVIRTVTRFGREACIDVAFRVERRAECGHHAVARRTDWTREDDVFQGPGL